MVKLFSLPAGEPVQFLLYDFDNPSVVERIAEHGGQVTDDEATADVVLTRNQDAYQSLKDRYAASRKTHVRMSGFVDRCIKANKFVLAPIPQKGVPGRIPGARRTEFTEDDDEFLCQYIAEILPEKGEGGRSGHFIYTDLMRRAEQFGQYNWAQRHTKDAWRERYRKNQGRLDQRITEIVEENPPALDGKGQYMARRYGKLDLNEEYFMLDAEEDAESATDNEDGPVLAKRECAQPQEEEEEEDGEEEHRRLEAELNPSDQDSYREGEEEGQGAQPTKRRSKGGPSLRSKATRRSLVSHRASKRRKAVASRRQEAPSPNDLDPTLAGSDGGVQDDQESGSPPVDEDAPATTELPNFPAASPEPEPAGPETSRRRSRARPVAPPVAHQTRARSRLHPASVPEPTPAPTPRRKRAPVAKAKSSAATLEAVAESSPHATHDEFVAHSEDESDIEVNVLVDSGDPPADSRARSLSADDLQTSVRLQRAGGVPSGTAGLDEDDQDDEDEETFPSMGTRAQAEKSRRAQVGKAAPPPGIRAASMKGKGKARETALHRR